jgi:hypothetical protein
MSRRKSSKNLTVKSFLGQMLLSRRGVYLISREHKLRCFRLVLWTDILARLDA